MHDLQSKWDLTSEGSAKNGVGKIIGSEVLLWGEENGDSTVISKIFPRAAAIAEALWSNPQSQGSDDNLWYQADPRMQLWRNTLVRRGLAASEMQPLWCAQRGPYSCTIDQGIPQ
jgi:hexosaminidase